LDEPSEKLAEMADLQRFYIRVRYGLRRIGGVTGGQGAGAPSRDRSINRRRCATLSENPASKRGRAVLLRRNSQGIIP
jgi:hypothetical protein